PGKAKAEVTFSAGTPAGVYQLGLKSLAGPSAQLPFTVDLFPQVVEAEPNDSPSTGQLVTLPATITGAIAREGDVDFYRFEARAGQQVGIQALTAAIGSKLEPVLLLTDASGKVLAESANGLLGHTLARGGTYALGIRDRDYRGNAGMHYRLQ